MDESEVIHILLVEDDQITGLLQKKILQDNHFQVTWAKSGEEAIDTFQFIQDKIDLILMDIDLGSGIDGTITAESILKLKEIPLVFLSCHTEKEVIQKTERITSYGFILKNSGESVLLSGIRMALKLYHSNLQKTKKEIELNNSYHYLRKVLSISTDGFVVVNSKGDIVDVNEAYCKISGYQIDELLNMKAWNIDCIDTPEMIQNRMRQIRANGSLFFETQHQKKNGQRFPVEVSVTYINEPEEFYVSFCRDISERKEHEAVLRYSEEKNTRKMTLAMKFAQMSYWMIDLKTFEINWRKGFDGIFDRDEESFHCHLDDFLMLIVPEAYVKSKSIFMRSIQNKSPLDMTFRVRKSDGDDSFLRLYAEYFEEENHSYMFGIIQNISKIKDIENELFITQYKLKEAMSIASLVPWEYDVKTSAFIFSDDFYTLYGTDAIQENGYQMSASDYVERFVFKEDIPYVLNVMKEANEQNDGHLSRAEHRIVRRDGVVRVISVSYFTVFDEQGRPRIRYGANQDVTERKYIEKNLQSSLQRNNALMNAYPDMMFLFNEQYEIIDCHPREEDSRYLIQPHLFINKTIDNVLPPDLCAITRYHIDSVLINKKPETDHYSLQIKQEIYYFESRYVLCEENFVLAIVRDVSEQEHLKQNQQILQKSLLQSQKMESIGRMAGGVAHDFNNMLGVITGSAELALMDLDPSHSVYEHIDQIRKAASRSAGITRQLLTFSRKQASHPKVVNLNSAVQSFLKILKHMTGENVQLRIQESTCNANIMIDPYQLDQILSNLCINARDAIQGNGEIKIEIGEKSFDSDFVSNEFIIESGDYILLQISDNGSGMTKDIIDKIFEPFFTTKELGKGTGLGLPTVYGIVKQNNGYILVDSSPGVGTSFSVYFQKYNELSLTEEEKEDGICLNFGNQYVLLVEDEESLLLLTEKMLERIGFKILSARNYQEAVNYAREYSDKISLLLSDVIMPDKNGVDVYRDIQALCPAVKTLFMSGYSWNILKDYFGDTNEYHMISKPFSISDLSAKIKEVLGI